MKKTKIQKGITLIALIITIVVLLILAIVTIGAIKDSKIIDHAQNASSEYTLAQEKEQIQLALSEWQIQKSIPGNTRTFKDVVVDALGDTAETVVENGDGTLTITMKKTGKQYTVTKDGEVEQLIKGLTLSNTTLSILVGKTATITATVSGGLNSENITYSSSSESIARVNSSGLITAIELGEATITAECEGYTATCKVTVREATSLEKYFLGANLDGIELTSLVNENMEFIANELMPEADKQLSLVTELRSEMEFSYNGGVAYIKYTPDENTGTFYKFKVKMDDVPTSDGDYGLVKIYDVTDNRIGKTVKYDNKLWTIIYDDQDYGIQMVCNETLNYTNNEMFELGKEDSLVNWNDSKVISEADMDKNNELSELERTVYSYNHAIETLNDACDNIVKDNPNIKVRSVGSNPDPDNIDDENATLYTSDELANISSGILNGKLKSTDFNYENDVDRMTILGIEEDTKDSSYGTYGYWLASRICGGYNDFSFEIRCIVEDERETDELIEARDDGYIMPKACSNRLRPVIILKSDVLVENPDDDSDYIIE